MKTVVSIPEDVYERVEALRRRGGKTRSQLYADALRLYLREHDSDEITRRLNDMADFLNEEYDEFAAEAARRTLLRVGWE